MPPTTLDKEPVVVVESVKEAIRSILVVLMAFGVIHVTQENMGLIMVAAGAVLSAVATMFVRSKVYAPVDKQGNPIVVHTLENFLKLQAMDPMPNTNAQTGETPEHRQARLIAAMKERLRQMDQP